MTKLRNLLGCVPTDVSLVFIDKEIDGIREDLQHEFRNVYLASLYWSMRGMGVWDRSDLWGQMFLWGLDGGFPPDYWS